MNAEINSPNWCWLTNGYTIERVTRYKRIIYRPDGIPLLLFPSYEEEHAMCKKLGLLVDEVEA